MAPRLAFAIMLNCRFVQWQRIRYGLGHAIDDSRQSKLNFLDSWIGRATLLCR